MVLLGFLGLCLSLSFILGLVCLSFFYTMSSYDAVGLLTSRYLVNAGLLVLILLGIGSALINQLSWLVHSSAERTYLQVQPVTSAPLIMHQQLKSVSASFSLASLFVCPAWISYRLIFDLPLSFLSLGSVVLVLSLLSHAAANLLAPFIVASTQRIPRMVVIGLICLFFGGTGIGVTRLVLPATLRVLYASQPEDFIPIYQQLPLNHPLSPTGWLAQTLTQSINPVTYLLLILVIVIYTASLAVLIQGYRPELINSRTRYSLGSRLRLGASTTHTFTRYPPLIEYQVRRLIRNDRELGYAFFLLLLAGFFFILLSQAKNLRQFETHYAAELFSFVLAWLQFFSIAFLLRFSFPLVSQLGSDIWLLLTAPRPRQFVVTASLLTSLLLGLPLVVIALVAWSILPFSGSIRVFGLLFSLASMVGLCLLQAIFGSLHPAFELASKPEQVTTTNLGLLSFIVSTLLSFVYLVTGYVFLKYHTSPLLLAVPIFTSIVLLLCLSVLSRYATQQYRG